MTPPLCITRKARRAGRDAPAITLQERLAYLDADAEMHPVGFAEVETPDGGRPLSTCVEGGHGECYDADCREVTA